jgi:hypothetical protein
MLSSCCAICARIRCPRMLVVIRKYLPQLRLCGYQIRSYRWQDSVVASRSVQSLYLLGCLYELPSQSITYLSHIPYAQLFVSQVVSIIAHYAQPSSWAKLMTYYSSSGMSAQGGFFADNSYLN